MFFVWPLLFVHGDVDSISGRHDTNFVCGSVGIKRLCPLSCNPTLTEPVWRRRYVINFDVICKDNICWRRRSFNINSATHISVFLGALEMNNLYPQEVLNYDILKSLEVEMSCPARGHSAL